MPGTHYDVLGVPPSATRAEIREAYVERARRLHPDRAGGDPSRARRMQEVNEAWRVLGHAARRSAYDATLAAVVRPEPAAARGDDDLDRPFVSPPAAPGDVTVAIARALPWVVVATVLVGIFVFTAFARRTSPAEGSPRDLLGHCLAPAGSARVTVPCDQPNDGEAVLLVETASGCPAGTAARPVRGGRWLCVR